MRAAGSQGRRRQAGQWCARRRTGGRIGKRAGVVRDESSSQHDRVREDREETANANVIRPRAQYGWWPPPSTDE